jgi:FtsZ-binding cell division protein ZapB
MTSNLNLEPSMRTSPAPGQTPSGNTYAPSVPISVYRQLAAELQSAKATAELLNNQNQQLTRQNQQLRQEIERVVQAASQLQQMANSFQDVPQPAPVEPPASLFEMVAPHQVMPQTPQQVEPQQVERPAVASRPVRHKAVPVAETGAIAKLNVKPNAKPIPSESVLSTELFTEQEEVRSRRPAPPEAAKDLSGIWLMVVIGFIVITAFGAGFMVVRPLLPDR